jgi:hypothetical protein
LIATDYIAFFDRRRTYLYSLLANMSVADTLATYKQTLGEHLAAYKYTYTGSRTLQPFHLELFLPSLLQISPPCV